ncbi:MAG: PAS domain S-box protein [Bryobacteraceae bacterium]
MTTTLPGSNPGIEPAPVGRTEPADDTRLQYRVLLDHASEGLAYCRMIFEDGEGLDFVYLAVNPAFETLTGLKNVTGKRATEVLPGVRESDPELLRTYARVADTGVPEKFETYVQALQMWLSIAAYSPKKGFFVAVFDAVTARKLAEDKIAWLASFPEQNPNPVVEIEVPGGVVCYANPAARNVFLDLHQQGLAHAWLSGLDQVAEALTQANRNQVSREVTVGNLCFAQTVHYLPEVRRLRVYGADITERKRAEDALRESEERYRMLFNTLIEGFCIIEVIFDADNRPIDYRFLEVNPAFEARTGLKEARGRLMRELAPDHEAHWFELYGQVALTGQPTRFVNEARALNRWFDVSAYRIGGPESRRVAILFNDITERKRAEDATRRSETKFRTIHELTSDALMLSDKSGFTDCNHAALAMFGCATLEEFCKHHPGDMSPPEQPCGTDSVTLASQHIATAMAKGSDHFEWVHKRLDTGETFPADVLLNAMELDGKPVLQGVVRDITERKQAEDARRRSEDELRALFDDAPLPYHEIDRNGIVLRVNRVECEMLGMEASEMVGRPIWDFAVPEEREPCRASIARTLAGTAFPAPYERRLRSRTGAEFVFQLHHRLILDPAGNVARIRTAMIDLTETKQLDASLAKERQLLHALMDQSPDHIYFKDTEGHFILVNAAHAHVLGCSDPAQMVGKTDFDFFGPEHADPAYADEQDLVQERVPVVSKQEKATLPDGREIWVHTTKLPLRDPSGKITGTFGISRDITERKKAENALRESELKYRTLVGHIPQKIFYKDRESVYVSCNDLFAQDFEIPAADIAGKTDFDISPRELAEKYRADDRRIMELGRTVELEEDYVAHGERYTVRTTKTPIFSEQGDVIGILGVLTDITERKRAEEALRETERQLRLAQKLESIGQLAAGIAHEINTPIQYIGDNGRFLQEAFRDLMRVLELQRAPAGDNSGPAVLAQALEQGIDVDYLQEEIPKAIEQLLQGVDSVAGIVRAMKEFSHRGPVEKAPLDLNRAIGSTILVSKNEWKYVAHLTTDLDPELPPVPCVAGEFNQVVLNLIVNAAHAIADVVKSAGRKGVIHISTRRNGAWAEIRVRDTGTGIPEAIQSKVFDPFFTTKEVGKGTGQGLSIAHGVIVKKHGGRLSFDTQCGAGTTFLIQLPLDQPEMS